MRGSAPFASAKTKLARRRAPAHQIKIIKMKTSPRIYLDYAATTPVDPEVLRAMGPYFSDKFGNAGSLHSFGQKAIAALDAARETVAASIGANFRELIFTGSATEANNLVLRGAVSKWQTANGKSRGPRIIISSIEHESIIETARDLKRGGVDVVYLPVDKDGLIDLKKLEASLSDNAILVSVMCANNEIGTIQPIGKIAQIIDSFKKNHSPSSILRPPFFHTDASQAFQFLSCDVRALGVDFMTVSSHKIYGPKGVGALYMKDSGFRIRDSGRDKQKTPLGHGSSFMDRGLLSPLITGGGQEFGVRSGTENIPAIVGFAKAVEISANSRELADKRIMKLRGELWRGIRKICPQAKINGVPFVQSPATDHSSCLPNILNVCFPGRDAQDLLTKFDLLGLAVSSGSACRARASLTSYVVEALGYSKERAKSSVRFSLGRPTGEKDIARALAIIEKAVQSAK